MEGHSFMANNAELAKFMTGGYVNTLSYFDSAVVGSNVSGCVSRAATFDSYLITETSLYKNISVLWIGVNEVNNTVGTGTTAYNNMKSYIQSRLTAGHRMFVYTMTPSTYAGRAAQFEIERDTFNDLIRNDLALLENVYVLDTDTKTELTDCTNATYFGDLLHPTKEGYRIASTLFTAKLFELYPLT